MNKHSVRLGGGWLTTNEQGANGVAVRVPPYTYRLRDVRQKNRPVPTVSESVSIRPRDVRCAVLLLRCAEMPASWG